MRNKLPVRNNPDVTKTSSSMGIKLGHGEVRRKCPITRYVNRAVRPGARPAQATAWRAGASPHEAGFA